MLYKHQSAVTELLLKTRKKFGSYFFFHNSSTAMTSLYHSCSKVAIGNTVPKAATDVDSVFEVVWGT